MKLNAMGFCGIAGLVVLFLAAPVQAQSRVKVFGNWPDTGFCDVEFGPSPAWQGFTGSNGRCNDQTSAVYVPFGMSATLCDNDQAGGLSPCRHFMPGTYPMDAPFNDKTSVVKVETSMIGYLNSAEFPTDVTIGVNVSGDPSNFNPSAGVYYGNSGDYIIQGYLVPIPSSCVQPNLTETTKANDARWRATWTPGQSLKVVLWARYKHLFGTNNWVGVQLSCLPADNGKRNWGG